MTASWLVAVNPTSGRGRGARWGREAVQLLRERGVDVRVMIAESAECLEQQCADALREGSDGLVVVGGDGMAHLGVNLAAAAGVPLGIVPAGTGNDFARHLELPRGDVPAAVDVVLHGITRTVDLGRLEESGRRFACVLSTGFDAAVNARANRLGWPSGRSRYHVAMVAELRAFRPTPLVVEVDGVSHEHRAMLVAVGNARSYGGGMRICPGADLTDGLLDVTVVDEISVLELLRLFPRVYSGRHVDHPQAYVYRGARVTVRPAAPGEVSTPAFADGEQVSTLPVTATCEPGALQVRVPPLP